MSEREVDTVGAKIDNKEDLRYDRGKILDIIRAVVAMGKTPTNIQLFGNIYNRSEDVFGVNISWYWASGESHEYRVFYEEDRGRGNSLKPEEIGIHGVVDDENAQIPKG